MTLEQIQVIHEELKKRLKDTAGKNLGNVSQYAEALLEKIYAMETMVRLRNTRSPLEHKAKVPVFAKDDLDF